MRVLFSDLDNTLIYSHRHKIKQPIVLAEMLKGKEQSFMTEKTYLFFKNQNMFKTVAVTTRTYEQYSRLENLTENINIKDAVVCNGAFLMHNGNEDKIWTEESLKISENESPYLFDIPMLKETNICFCPKEIENFETKGQKIVCDGLFSDAVCDGFEEMRKEGKF